MRFNDEQTKVIADALRIAYTAILNESGSLSASGRDADTNEKLDKIADVLAHINLGVEK